MCIMYEIGMFEWSLQLIEQTGYLGVMLGMILENVFPPIPSELIMMFAGGAAKTSSLTFIGVVFWGAVGSVIGLLPWYYGAKWYGYDRLKQFANRHGRYLTLSVDEIENAHQWFIKHGEKMVFFGRLIPGIRTLIAIPVALMGMNFKKFLLISFVSSLLWDGIFAAIGYFAWGTSDTIEHYMNIGTYIIAGIVVVWYIYRVITFKKKK